MKCLVLQLAAAALGVAFVVPAHAAPRIGESFFVADPRTAAEAFPGVARSPSGFVVAWVAAGEAAFGRLGPDGELGESGGVMFSPYETNWLGYHGGTRATAPVEVVDLAGGAFVAFQRVTSALSSSAGRLTRYDPGGSVIGPTGVFSDPLGLSQSLFLELSFAATSRGREWATLQWGSGVTNGPLDLTLLRGGASGEPATTTLASYPFQIPNPPAIEPGGVGLASDGTGYLAAWAEDQVIKLAPISPAGGVGTITTHAGWATSASLRLASNGAGYLIAWVDPSGSLRASRVDAGGKMADPTDIPVASGASRVLDLDPAGSDYLVTYESAMEAGLPVRAARIAADGTVRDPDGFDLGATAEIAVTAVGSDVWLMIQASHAQPDRTLLEGRFIGERLPAPPANPVPPPSPRVSPDGGVPGNGGSFPADAGTSAGGANGSGGAAPADGSASAGGAASAEAGTRRESSSSEITGGCGCTVAAREREPDAVTAVLLLIGLAFSRRKER